MKKHPLESNSLKWTFHPSLWTSFLSFYSSASIQVQESPHQQNSSKFEYVDEDDDEMMFFPFSLLTSAFYSLKKLFSLLSFQAFLMEMSSEGREGKHEIHSDFSSFLEIIWLDCQKSICSALTMQWDRKNRQIRKDPNPRSSAKISKHVKRLPTAFLFTSNIPRVVF